MRTAVGEIALPLAAAQCRVLPARPLSLGLNFYTNTARPKRNAQNRWIINCEVLLIVLLCWCVESKKASAHKTFENGLFNKHSSTDLRRVCVTQERGAVLHMAFQSRSLLLIFMYACMMMIDGRRSSFLCRVSMLLLFRVSAVLMHPRTQLAKPLLPQGLSVCLRLSPVELLIPFLLCYRSLFQPSGASRNSMSLFAIFAHAHGHTVDNFHLTRSRHAFPWL